MTQTPVGPMGLAPAKRPATPSDGPAAPTDSIPRFGPLLGLCLSMASITPCLAHGIHQHGLAHVEVSQQDHVVNVNFRAPLDSLIGFENHPANDEQRAQARVLLEKLQQAPEAVIQLPPAAGCTPSAPPKILEKTLGAADVAATALSHSAADAGHPHGHGQGQRHGHDLDHDHDGHGHGHGHDDPAHDHAHKHGQQHDHEQAHGHGDHAHAGESSADQTDGHAHKTGHTRHALDEPHDHDAQRHDEDESEHSDLSAEYQFSCQHPNKLRSLQLTVFKHWPRIHAVDTAVVSDHGQKAARLKAHHPRLSW